MKVQVRDRLAALLAKRERVEPVVRISGRLPRAVDPRHRRIDRDAFRAAAGSADVPPYGRAVAELLEGERSVETLRAVQSTIPKTSGMDYSPAALSGRAQRRMARANIHAPPTLTRLLDIGCARGENIIAQQTIRPCAVTGVDIAPLLDPAAPEFADHTVHKASVSSMPVDDNSVDLAVSFNAFEHFDDPIAAVREIARVLRTGGAFYTEFGPPWNGAFGPHLKSRISLPYVQHLFPADVVSEVASKPDLSLGLNRWTVAEFVELFTTQPDLECRLLSLRIGPDHLWLPRLVPDAFAGFDPHELVTSAFHVTLVKS